jgi:hypothetical protein
MQSCQWRNQQVGRYGIVTNGEGWKFYEMEIDGKAYESLLHGIDEMSILLGIIRSFFQ